MKRFPISPSRLAAALACACVAVSSIACVSLRQSYPDRKFYTIESAFEGERFETVPGTILYVRSFRVQDTFAHSSIVYRTGENSWDSDSYNKFFVAPRNQITNQVTGWLRDSGLFETVLGRSTGPEITHFLEGNVVKLFGDYRDGGNPQAVLALSLTLTDASSPTDRIVLRETYEASEPFASDDVEGLIAGWEAALDDVLRQFARDVRELPREELFGADAVREAESVEPSAGTPAGDAAEPAAE